MHWPIFILVILLQLVVTYPKFRETCLSCGIDVNLIYFIHHILDVFLFWSFLFVTTKLEYKIHFWTAILVMLHWATYDNKCIITVEMNKLCGYPEDQWLDSLKNRIPLRGISEWFHFIWIILLCGQDIYHGALR